MNESAFLALAETILDALEAQVDDWFERLDIDVEGERNGNVLTLTFANGTQAVINSQAPKCEMWVAAVRGGFHYKLQDGQWRDTRSGTELAQALSEICSEQAGVPLAVTLPDEATRA